MLGGGFMKKSKNYDSPFGRLNDSMEIDEYEKSVFEDPEGIVEDDTKKSSINNDANKKIHKDYDKFVD